MSQGRGKRCGAVASRRSGAPVSLRRRRTTASSRYDVAAPRRRAAATHCGAVAPRRAAAPPLRPAATSSHHRFAPLRRRCDLPRRRACPATTSLRPAAPPRPSRATALPAPSLDSLLSISAAFEHFFPYCGFSDRLLSTSSRNRLSRTAFLVRSAQKSSCIASSALCKRNAERLQR